MFKLHDQMNKDAQHRSILVLLLIFALLASTIHVTLHDGDDSGSGLIGHAECQLTYLLGALLPTKSLPAFSFSKQSLVISYSQVIPYLAAYSSFQARAPPL
tara:strand:+ start:1968 stop:2270 length:303 start_codon:yes stop_codon:yes gene_type:complete